jgi:chromosome segregation ATPase
MIEPIMFFGIGFLVASLFGLVLIPLVHNRAVRLTMRRLEAATPLSMAEIQADKDQLRAEFAMSTRRLELSVEQMKVKATGQLADLGKKSDSINRLKAELGEKTAAIFSLEARERTLKDQLQATEAEHSVKINSLRESERQLADKRAELAKIAADLGERTIDADSQRLEASALRVQVETLKESVALHEREAQEISARLTKEREDTASATAELNEARNKADKLTERVAELERALVAQTTEAEVLTRRVSELDTRVNEQTKLLSSRDAEIARLNEAVNAGRKTETSLREELATTVNRGRAAAEGNHHEKLLIEDQLAQSKAERTKLQQDIAAMKREAEQSWAAERVENALLRERINDIAAQIARMTVALDGSNSPIEAMLASDAVDSKPGVNGEHKPVSAAGNRGSLADRIRALQAKASRIPATTPSS